MIKFRVIIFEENGEIGDFIHESNIVAISCIDFKSDEYVSLIKSADAIVIDMSCYDKTDVFKFISKNSNKSIFALNAKEEIKYQLYECGAWDVFLEPIDKIELKYKINLMVKNRRYKPKRYYLGDLVYEVETGTLIKEDRNIVLPTLQNKIFALLVNGYYDSRIVRKEEIFKSMIDESSRIQNHIARLRYSLTYIKSRQVVIDTVYGKGYKLLVLEK